MKLIITNDGDPSVGFEGERLTLDWPGLEDRHTDEQDHVLGEVHKFFADLLDHAETRLIMKEDLTTAGRKLRQVRDAFGDCSHLYETTTADELLRQFDRDSLPLADFVAREYDAEEVLWDRANIGLGGEEAVAEHEQFMRGIRDRLSRLGFKVGGRR